MCGRYVQTNIARYRARLLELAREPEPQRAESWNVAPTTLALAVRIAPQGRVADWLTWGLQGSGSVHETDSEGTPLRPSNARVESVADKPFFREPWKSRRCLIPADGWYEWKLDRDSVPGPRRGARRGPNRGRKQPYYFHRCDGQPLFLAALWTGDTYCLLTTPADGDLAQVHHRRPLTLRDETAAAWLQTEPATTDEAIAAAIPPDAIAFHPVSAKVSNARADDPDLVEPVTLDPVPEFLPGF